MISAAGRRLDKSALESVSIEWIS
ncbi:hypothetical protein EMIT0194P_30077 [Pseudomonas serbica]